MMQRHHGQPRRIALLAAMALLPMCAAPAHALTVWIDAVRDKRTGAEDVPLTRALRSSLTLHGFGADSWIAGRPGARGCAGRCVVVRFVRDADSGALTIDGREFPSGRRTRATLRLARATLPDVVAEALAIRCTDLLDRHLPQPIRVTQRVSSEVPPPLVRQRRNSTATERAPTRGIALDIGPTVSVGLDSRFLTVGVELGATLVLWRWLAARASVGYQDGGKGSHDAGEYTYRAAPLSLLLGGQWRFSRLRLAAFAGLSMMAVWLRLERLGRSATEAIVGPAAEVRADVRVASRLSIGASLRATFGGVTEAQEEQTLVYRFPGALLTAMLGLRWSF